MDLRKVKTLIDLVQQSDISELEIQEGEERVRISRGPIGTQPAASGTPPLQVLAVPAAHPAPSVGAADAVPSAADVPAEAAGYVLKSPMVGTFYRSSAPGGKPFIEIGATVKADEPVCIIEAMKLLNEIEAGAAGVVKEILVENGQPVEYGQPLMVIA
jgi:acetyl-CoA carboxylase biotin carboxyl carrier protein